MNINKQKLNYIFSQYKHFQTTDITQHALEQLASSKVKKVYLIGRRGPFQAAFTIAELREMLKLPACKTQWSPEAFAGLEDLVPKLPRPKKRITELMLKSCFESTQTQGESTQREEKSFLPIFLRSPLEIIGKNSVEKVKLGMNRLDGFDLSKIDVSKELSLKEFAKLKAVPTGEIEEFDCNLAVTSIGYKSVQADGEIPFDESKGVAVNTNGKIKDGLYTAGWLASGPTGVILNTMTNAFNVADTMVKDLKSVEQNSKPGFEHIGSVLKEKNVQIVTWEDWLKIDQFEIEEGKKVGKPREKIVDVKKMLEVAA